jgi:hypothetical protein
MSYRFFSRFVRWYRWPLIIGIGAAGISGQCDDFPWWQATLVGFVACGWMVGVWNTKPSIARALARHNARRTRDEEAERVRIRSLPLRGWTK